MGTEREDGDWGNGVYPGVSRRTLNKRFKRIVGHTVSREIWRMRFAQARRLNTVTQG